MADNGIRQLGHPRIEMFAERVRPDPLHCEINARQHMLDLIYSESLQRNVFSTFIEVLSAPISHVANEEDVSGMSKPCTDNAPISNDSKTNMSSLLSTS